MRALGMAVGMNNAGRHTSEIKRMENGSRKLKQGKEHHSVRLYTFHS